MKWLFSLRLRVDNESIYNGSGQFMITIQQQDFNAGEEIKKLQTMTANVGAVATFIGLVRNFEGQEPLGKLILEHYPGMTERRLQAILSEAQSRWSLLGARVIHRIGELSVGEQIVFVGAASEHRQDAFQACEFVMDFLKTDAPLWKKALTKNGEHWVEAKNSDTDAAAKWY